VTLARGWKVLAVASITVFLVSLDVTIVNIALPEIVADFHSDPTTLSWVLSGYNIAFAACLLTSGRLADRFGRRRVFFIGIWTFSIASALCGLAPGTGMLIAARLVQALGGALILPASLALVLPEFPVERRSAAIGVWGAVGGLAAAAGPIFGSLLIDTIGWRGLFFINTPLCVVAVVFGRRLLVESRDPNAHGLPDIVGALLATSAVALVVLGIVEGHRWTWTSARTLAVFGVGLTLLALFVVRCAKTTDPVLDLHLFEKRFFTVANTSAMLFSAGFFGMFYVNVRFLTEVWHYSVAGSGLAFAPGPFMSALVAAPAGRLADRYGHRVVVVPGALTFALGVGMIVRLVPAQPDYWRTYFPAFVVVGIGVGLTISTIGAASNAFLPPDRFAMGGAVNATLRQIGSAFGVAIVVAIVGERITPLGADRAFTFVGVAAVLSGLLMWALYRPPIAAVDDAAVPSTEVVVVAPL
jgi:EmrB/QacA subfamily drug resistance transporter